jgi:periplasmic protein TonB
VSVIAAYDEDRRAEAARWTICFAAVVTSHALAAFVLLHRFEAASDFDAGAPAVLIDLPQAAAPPMPPNDLEPLPDPQTDPTPPVPDELIKPPPDAMAEISLPEPEPPKPKTPEETPPPSTPSVEMPAVQASAAPGAEVQTRRDVLRWESELVAHIERFKRYPAAARDKGQQGVAQVAFTIDHQGHLLSSHIVQSSGSPLLDQETLAMLARAQPMPTPPGKVPDSQLYFVVPVFFTIR